jgi:hypothetical protein
MIYSLSVAYILHGRCLELLLIRPMPKGRGNPLRLLLVKGPSRLQQEKLQLAVAAEERQPPEEEKGAFCQEVGDLVLQHMWKIMGDGREDHPH